MKKREELQGDLHPLQPNWNILAVSDEARFLHILQEALAEEKIRLVGVLEPSEAFLSLSQEEFHILILSVRRLRSEDHDLLRKAMEADDQMPVLLLMDQWKDQLFRIKDLVRSGTWTVLGRPQPPEHLRILVLSILERIRLQREIHYLRHRESYIHRFEGIIAHSESLRRVLHLVERIASSDATVLIHGESGTGKELIAASIHFNSPRRGAPFVAVNCASLHENLLESELFGHEKGAFTGAHRRRIGRLEQADGGTLFLDEVGDMSPRVQAKVLRVVQEKTFERLGGTKTIRVNVRFVAATNRDLRRAVAEGRFREDLYWRLNVIPIHLPPLRERPEDILPLAEFFLQKYRGADQSRPKGFHPEALQRLQCYPWPGNVRELENVVERSILVCRGDWIQPEDLMLPTGGREPLRTDLLRLPPGGVRLEEVERELILQALERAQGVQKRAAELLGISPRAIHYKIRKHGIQWSRRRLRMHD